jgi:hypothetical protein
MKNKSMIEANKTLETGAIEALINHITGEALKDIRERFAKVKEAKKYAEHSGDAHSEYMEMYVQFNHYAERYTLMLQGIQDIVTGTHREFNLRSACTLEKKEDCPA